MPSEASRQTKQENAKQAREVIDVFHEISTLLVRLPHLRPLTMNHTNKPQNADLDRGTLSICISLIENGVNPEALAVIIQTSQ